MSGAGHVVAHSPPHQAEHAHASNHVPSGHHPSQHGHVPACCQVTGKSLFALASHAPASDPPILIIHDLSIASADLGAIIVATRFDRPAPSLAHGPPKYLRFASLLV